MEAILNHMDSWQCDAKCVAVVSDRKKSRALQLARERGIPDFYIPLRKYDSREKWCKAIEEQIQMVEPDLLVLAGFMKILSPGFVQAFQDRIVNIHPSLLPDFPGIDAPRQALEARVKFTGCSVHLVDEGVDTGRVLAQEFVPVFADDTVESLHKRIKQMERKLYPETLRGIALGEIPL